MNELFHHLFLHILQIVGVQNILGLKSAFVFISAFLGGMVFQTFVFSKILENVRTNPDLNTISVVRVERNGKKIYFINPDDMFDIANKIMVITSMKWFTQKKIVFSDVRKARFNLYLLGTLGLLLCILGVALAFNTIDVFYWSKEVIKNQIKQ